MAGRTVTRADLSDAVYEQVGLSRDESGKLVASVLEQMSSALASGESVKLSSFGSFTLRNKALRIGRNPKTGKHNYPKLELVRLTIPRRVYTQSHMDVVAESVIDVYENRDNVKGLQMVYEPKYLRFFQAKFESL